MARNPQKKPDALPLEDLPNGSIFASESFEHDGTSYSAGVHNDLPDALVRAIVGAGKAESVARPADRSTPVEPPAA